MNAHVGRPRPIAVWMSAIAVVLSLVGVPAPAQSDMAARAASHSQARHKPKVLTRNRLYQIKKLRAGSCTPPGAVSMASAAELEAFYTAELSCLNRSWKKQVKKSGIRFRPPRLVVYSGVSTASRCGIYTVSFFCSLGRPTIFMKADEIVTPWNQGAGDPFSQGITQLAATHTLAHEYGHHLQHLSRILATAYPLTRQDSSRLELQASCLGDVFMSANATAYPIAPEYLAPEWERYWRIISIDTLHGTEDNQRYWTHRGFDQRSPRACNTWKASRTSTA